MTPVTLVKFPLRILSVLLLRCIAASATSALPTDEHGDYNGADLIAWIRDHPDGDVHPSVAIRRERPGSGLLGLFVSSAPGAAPIEKGDVIAQVPWDRMIHPDDKYKKYQMFSCRAIYNLAKELSRGEESDKAPYVRYLLSQDRGVLPGEWTQAGKDFFAEVLGRDALPPHEDLWRNQFEKEWLERCSADDDDEMARAAYWLFVSRDEDSLMVPIYDMANHSNDPDKLNTLSFKPDSAGDTFRFVASRTIQPGEQIYNSYNRCNECSDVDQEQCETFSFATTPDLLVNFGFTEDYPQNWMFYGSEPEDSSDDDSEIQFCLTRDPETGELDALWDEEDMPDREDVRWFKQQHARLQKLAVEKDTLEARLVREEGADAADDKMTRWEWGSIWRYHSAVSAAIHVAIQAAEREDVGDEL